MGLQVKYSARSMYSSDAAAAGEFEKESERLFFQSLRMRNGSFKTTYAERMGDVDALLMNFLPPPGHPLEVMDVAISSGVTTYEWSQALKGGGRAHHLVAGDLAVRGTIYAIGSWFHVLSDESDFPLQFEFLGRPYRNWVTRREIVSLQFLWLWALRFLAGISLAVLRPLSLKWCTPSFLTVRSYETPLVSKRLLRESHISVLRDNIFEENPELVGRFDVLRAANILNRGYFSDERLRAALSMLKRRLKVDGLLVLCRTLETGENQASILRLNASGRFDLCARIGGGSEIEQLALE